MIRHGAAGVAMAYHEFRFLEHAARVHGISYTAGLGGQRNPALEGSPLQRRSRAPESRTYVIPHTPRPQDPERPASARLLAPAGSRLLTKTESW